MGGIQKIIGTINFRLYGLGSGESHIRTSFFIILHVDLYSIMKCYSEEDN